MRTVGQKNGVYPHLGSSLFSIVSVLDTQCEVLYIVRTSWRKNISFTLAAPSAIAAPTPSPLNTRPTINVPHDFETPDPTVATIPMSVESR